MINKPPKPNTAKPATPKPITEPPVKDTFNALAKLVRAAWVVRTFAKVATFIPTYPANAENTAPIIKATAIIGEAETADLLIASTLKEKWDLVICDMSMPGRSGLDALNQIKQSTPQLPVLIMSMHPEDQ